MSQNYCGKCGKALEEEWISCPYCGKAISYYIQSEFFK